MAVSKIAYDGHTLIDLTGDTAVAADVASGKTFHLANGVKTTGTNTGGGGSAVFPYACTLTITLDNYLDVDQTFDLEVYFRGPDVDDPTKVVWRHETFNFSGTDNSDTHIINLVANPDGQYQDGVYIPVGDGGTVSNITSGVNCTPRYVTIGTYGTGSEQVYLTITGNNASCVVYVSGI